jgi:uncharacterized protein YkwD
MVRQFLVKVHYYSIALLSLLLQIAVLVAVSDTAAAQPKEPTTFPGPCLEERKKISHYLKMAQKAGVGISPYETALREIDASIAAGGDDKKIKDKVDRLLDSLSQQARNLKTLKASSDGSAPPLGTDIGKPVTERAMEVLLFSLVNQHRREAGLPVITPNADLAALAKAHAFDMVRRNFFSHTDPNNRGFEDRIAGVKRRHLCENISTVPSHFGNGFGMVRQSDKGLMNSPGHKTNILRETNLVGGVGVVYDTKGGIKVCQIFGAN